MGLFSSFGIGTSGLNTAQQAMSVTSHNIANVNNENYTRQRAVIYPQEANHSSPGDFGMGSKVYTITRIHDEFTFARLRTSTNQFEYDSEMSKNLDQISTYFADLDGVGLQNDLKNYFDAWNSLSSNPNSSTIKVNLAQSAITLTNNLSKTRDKVQESQNDLNMKIKTNMEDFNRMAKEIANINQQIMRVETVDPNKANDLRDQRDKLELGLSKLLDINVFKGNLESENSIDTNLTDSGKDYHLNIAGQNIVDGVTFHPVTIDEGNTKNGYYTLYHKSYDGSKYELSEFLHGGKVGALLDLRGRVVDPITGVPNGQKVQSYLDDLDALAKSVIEKTNAIYAQSASSEFNSKKLDDSINDVALVDYDDQMNEGEFDVVVYNNAGEEVARKTVSITHSTIMYDPNDTTNTANAVISQLNKSTDDTADNDTTNDVDDYFDFYFTDNQLLVQQASGVEGYKLAFEDSGTNFTGIVSVNQFLTGSGANDIALKSTLADKPSLIQAHKAPVVGNNEVANGMVQIQYDTLAFIRGSGEVVNETIGGFYSFLTTSISSDGANTTSSLDTSTALKNAIEQEYQSISGVNLDEELASLMKFQTSYQASAKIISTIDTMLNALLSIKQ
jgi:flagellar hook-associated protein 1 FlgK